ncbi:MAG: EF-Tu/IF-2/RF-3 family GTPase [Promethearchaeati archaeon]
MSEKIEKSFNVGILGENQVLNTLIGQAFGAPGTKSDLQFFNRLDESLGYIFCAITPLDYPDKIKPLLQTLYMTDIFVLAIDLNIELNSVVGELLIAMDQFNRVFKKRSIIAINNIKNNKWKLPETINKLNKILKETSLENIEIISLTQKEDFEILKKKVIELGLDLSKEIINKENHAYTKILIDHVFPVKGVGTVALALIKEGTLKKGQMLEILGFNGSTKKTVIKNIQKQDRNFNYAYKYDRVGLVLKGIKPLEINRDNILVSPEIFKKERVIQANIYVNEFYKPKNGKITPGGDTQYYGLVNLTISPLKFLEGDTIFSGNNGSVKIQLDKHLYHDGSGLIGIITELNKFEKKNRIVGFFKQT